MHTTRKPLAIVTWLATMITPLTGLANPEIPPAYDTRSAGMGGTGQSFLDGASGGVYLNPALLDGIDKLEVAITVAPMFPSLGAPLAAPGTVSPTKNATTSSTVVPLFLVAAGYRLHDRVTLGLGAYVANGIGGEYKNVSILDSPATPAASKDDFNDMKMTVATLEGSLPVAVRVADGLSLGLAWRPAYTMQSTSFVFPNGAGPGLVNHVKQDLSGSSLLGLTAGVRYRVSELLSIGASYRNRMTMDLDGDTSVTANVTPPMVPTTLASDASTTSKWKTPHQVRAGASLSLLQKKLTLALEGRAQFYEAVNKTVTSTIDLDGQPLQMVLGMPELKSPTPLGWKDAYTGQLGAEYWVIDWLALRAGFLAGNSATSSKYPNPIAPPPGLLLTYTAGVGARWSHWEAGLSGSLMHGSAKVSSSDIAAPGGVPAGPAGTYDGRLIVVSASAGYRL